MDGILLFAGTTEGRKLAEYLAVKRIPVTVSVATEYGAELLQPSPYVQVLQGRKDRGQILDLLQGNTFRCCVDATHPFALQVSKEIRAACLAADLPYLRLARETNGVREAPARGESAGTGETYVCGGTTGPVQALRSSTGGVDLREKGRETVYYVDSLEEAVQVLRTLPGRIFLMTGSKELPAIVKGIGDVERIYARVLPTQASLELCRLSGLPQSHIVAMQGPFSQGLNAAMLRQVGAGCILTKESGSAGGFTEKIGAARECGAAAVVIRNPERSRAAETSEEELLSFREVVSRLEELFGLPRVLTLAGIGPGGSALRTGEYWEALAEADVLFGAPRMLAEAKRDLQQLRRGTLAAGNSCTPWIYRAAEASRYFQVHRSEEESRCSREHGTEEIPCYPWYQGEKIRQFLRENSEYRHPMVVFSGDTGLFSGAQRVREIFEGNAAVPVSESSPTGCSISDQAAENWQIRTLCGISSVARMAALLGIPWQNCAIVSVHGRECSVIAQLRIRERMFLLVSGPEQCGEIGAQILKAQRNGALPENLHIACGRQLGTEEERAEWISAKTLEAFSASTQEVPEQDRHRCHEGKGSLLLLYFENPAAGAESTLPGIADEEFTRGKVPMTKEEIRVLALCRLQIRKNSVVWDVGAGTGSVSVEAAMLCSEGRVYAIEREEEALSLLRANREKFAADNLEIVRGEAPEALAGLPAPDHVFVGGSGGHLEEILQITLRENPRAYVVISCVTLETLQEVQRCVTLLADRITQPRIAQIAVSRARHLGKYHLLQAGNPVFLVDFRGEPGENGK